MDPIGIAWEKDCAARVAGDLHDAEEIDAFEDARSALPVRGNGLLVLQFCEDVDEAYLDIYLRSGMDLLLREIKRRHPRLGDASPAAQPAAFSL